MPLVEWKHRLNEAVMRLSRSMEPVEPTGPVFLAGEEDLERLDVVTVDLGRGRVKKRAMNCGLWDSMQDAADFDDDLPEADDLEEPDSAAEDDDGPKNIELSEDAFASGLAEYKRDWLRRVLAGRIGRMTIGELEELAGNAGIAIATEWRLTREFLELFDAEWLQLLAEELGVDVSQCRNETEVVAVMLHSNPEAVPRTFSEATEPLAQSAEC